MPKKSAGLLVYRVSPGGVEVFLAHPGGPIWAKRDMGSWTIPKGEFEEGEDAWDAARREVRGEIGIEPPAGVSIPRSIVLQAIHSLAPASNVGDHDVDHEGEAGDGSGEEEEESDSRIAKETKVGLDPHEERCPDDQGRDHEPERDPVRDLLQALHEQHFVDRVHLHAQTVVREIVDEVIEPAR